VRCPSGNDAKREQVCAVSIASIEYLAMYEDEWLTRYIILIFVVFISGLFLGALFSPAREKALESWHARLAADKGKPRHDE